MLQFGGVHNGEFSLGLNSLVRTFVPEKMLKTVKTEGYRITIASYVTVQEGKGEKY
jgi:hypothetical protein